MEYLALILFLVGGGMLSWPLSLAVLYCKENFWKELGVCITFLLGLGLFSAGILLNF